MVSAAEARIAQHLLECHAGRPADDLLRRTGGLDLEARFGLSLSATRRLREQAEDVGHHGCSSQPARPAASPRRPGAVW